MTSWDLARDKGLQVTLTHWSRVTHICVSKLNTIGSDNGLSPGRRQAIIWTIDGILLIGPLGTNFSEILIGIQTFSFKKLHLKTSSAKWRLFCLGLNQLTSSFRMRTLVQDSDMTLIYCSVWWGTRYFELKAPRRNWQGFVILCSGRLSKFKTFSSW